MNECFFPNCTLEPGFPCKVGLEMARLCGVPTSTIVLLENLKIGEELEFTGQTLCSMIKKSTQLSRICQ